MVDLFACALNTTDSPKASNIVYRGNYFESSSRITLRQGNNTIFDGHIFVNALDTDVFSKTLSAFQFINEQIVFPDHGSFRRTA